MLSEFETEEDIINRINYLNKIALINKAVVFSTPIVSLSVMSAACEYDHPGVAIYIGAAAFALFLAAAPEICNLKQSGQKLEKELEALRRMETRSSPTKSAPDPKG